MKKSLLCLVLALSLLLCACSGADETLITPVTQSFKDFGTADYGFSLRIELGGRTCVLLASGNISMDENSKQMTGEIEETLMGDNIGIMQVEWKNGTMKTDGIEEKLTWEEMRSSLIYAHPLVFDSEQVKSAEKTTTIAGTLYRHYVKDNSQNKLLYSLLGSALPEVCGVVSVVEDETEFKDIVCEYTLDKEGNPAGYSVSFTVIYQDTPPYVPGVNQDKDKYTVEVDVEFRANYNN
ncbi:MAG: hypothetical protein II987_01090 [Clostridia bacterium]|nr:hypothetical protein [Clostridia bacterium]